MSESILRRITQALHIPSGPGELGGQVLTSQLIDNHRFGVRNALRILGERREKLSNADINFLTKILEDDIVLSERTEQMANLLAAMQEAYTDFP